MLQFHGLTSGRKLFASDGRTLGDVDDNNNVRCNLQLSLTVTSKYISLKDDKSWHVEMEMLFRKTVSGSGESDSGITASCFRGTCNFNDCYFDGDCYHYGELAGAATTAAAAQDACRSLATSGQLLVIDSLEEQTFLTSTLNYLSN